MRKKVLIISSSLRPNSNSEILAKECERGAREAGNEVSFLSLKGKKLNFCMGCMTCQSKGKCVQNDDGNEMMEQVKEAEVLVFATPIYYYGVSGQLKTLFDRLNALYAADYKFRKVYLIATAADGSSRAFDKAYTCLQGWVDCFARAELCGKAVGAGIDGAGEAKNHAEALKNAYELGKNL